VDLNTYWPIKSGMPEENILCVPEHHSHNQISNRYICCQC